MRNGLEGRTPFIDKSLSVYGFHLPFNQKLAGKQGKYALKAWLAAHLPDARPFARKRGFTVPVGGWIAADAHRLAAGLARLDGIGEIIHTDQIAPLFSTADRKAGLLAWRILFYGLWHQIHVRGIAADQPIVEILNS